MAARGPWSVKGIDLKAREAALQAARTEGVTLGDYLNRLLLDSEGEREESQMSSSPQQKASNDTAPGFNLEALDRLTRRIEAVEARSTLAITGIDQSVVGLLARLDNNQNAQAAMEGRIELNSDELRQTQELLEQRIQRMETDDTSAQNLRALKSLEVALERLAGRVEDGQQKYNETTTDVRAGLSAMDERVNKLSGNVDQKISGLSNQVESTLEAAAARIAKAVEDAELRTEGAQRHLSDRMSQLEADLFEEKRDLDNRFSNIETKVGATLSSVTDNIDRLGNRMADTESRASRALEQVDSQNTSLAGISERLNRAEVTTDSALEGLEQSFNRLDERIGEFDADLKGGSIADLREQLESRVRSVAEELSETISSMRADLAKQIEQAANAPTEAFAEINTAVSEMHKRMKRAEQRQNQTVEAIGEEVAKLTETLDRRVRQIEQRNDSELSSTVRDKLDTLTASFQQRMAELESRDGTSGLKQVGDKMTKLTDVLTERVNASEERSAAAIRDFTEHVSTLTRNLSAKQEQGLQAITGQIQASEDRQTARMDEALAGVKERIAQVEEATSSSISPVQKAMASLAERLQAVEDFATPPGARRAPSPDLKLTSFEESLGRTEKKSSDFPSWEDPIPPRSEKKAAPLAAVPEKASFESALPDPWADEEDAFSTPTALKPLEDDDGFDNGDDFASHLNNDTQGFDLDAAEADADGFGSGFNAAPAGPNDYLARARAAANAGLENNRSRKHSPRPAKSGGGTKIPLVAAASVLALTAAGTIGVLAMRGKQDTGVEMMSVNQNTSNVGSETLILPDVSGESTTPVDESDAIGDNDTDSSGVDYDTEYSTEEVEDAAPPPKKKAEPVEPAKAEPAKAKAEPAKAVATPKPQPAAAEASYVAPQPKPAETRVAAATPVQSLTIQQYQTGMEALNNGDITTGAALIRQSADAGESIAQYRLSKLYERGQGVPRDLALSREWTEKAALSGNVKAMHDLAVFYAEGEGGPQSYAGAVQWFRKAADYGLVDSQYNLGVLYEQGLGVTANPAEALYWFRVADKLGDNAASAKIEELKLQVAPEVAEKTSILASQYQPQQSDALANGRFPATNTSSSSLDLLSGGVSSGSNQTDMVREAQDLLNAMGYNAGAPDGDFGLQTRQAILSFQSANGLPQSGEVTATLLRQLNAEASGL